MDKRAQQLRDAFNRVNHGRLGRGQRKLQLKELAALHDVSPGLVSQYFRGHEPLNVKWQMRFAEWLGLSPLEIWADFPHKELVSGKLPEEVTDLAVELLDYDPKQVRAVIEVLKASKKAARK